VSESHPRLSAQSKLSKKAAGPVQVMMSDSSATPERIVSGIINIPPIWVAGPSASGRIVASLVVGESDILLLVIDLTALPGLA
jgi:hypothetical protein